MENGQADTGPETLSGLASFLTDKPEEESDNEEVSATDESPEEDNDESEQDDQPEESDEDEEPEETPVVDRKIAVKIKGEDGTETTQEISEAELIAGYHRQADYTRKTQALAERENQAVQLFTQKHQEIRQHYMQEAQSLRVALAQVAGIKSESEMAEMAHNDPAGWVAEKQRQEYLGQLLNNVDSRIAQERQRSQAESQALEQQQNQAMAERSWVELRKAGIDKEKLADIYQKATKAFGYQMEEFDSVYDHRAVLVLKDALAYRALKDKAPQVTQKAKDAPRMPNKQTTPANERKAQKLDAKFKGGRAKLSDLASLLM